MEKGDELFQPVGVEEGEQPLLSKKEEEIIKEIGGVKQFDTVHEAEVVLEMLDRS